MTVKAIPDDHPRVAPYLIVSGAPALIEFLTRVFGATESLRVAMPDGDVMHAEVRIGESVIMIGGAAGEGRPIPAAIHVYVDDVDQVYRQALDAGATSVATPEDKFYGDRNATVVDPSGNTWFLAQRIEEVSREDIQRLGQAELERRRRSTESE